MGYILKMPKMEAKITAREELGDKLCLPDDPLPCLELGRV